MQAPEGALVESYLVRDRNALALYGNFAQIIHDLDLHIVSQGLDYDPFTRQLLIDGLSALGLHLATRPVDEYVGWTVQIRQPLMNLFFTGDARTGALVGRAFTDPEDVAARDESVFFSQSKREFGDPQLSSVAVTGVDLYGVVEQFYEKSEQKLARFFPRDAIAGFIVALPDVDANWLRAVSPEEAFDLARRPRVEHLADRYFRFRCGCDSDKVAGILVGAYGQALDELFGDSDEVEVECPRCASRVSVSRRGYERLLRDHSQRR